MLPQALSFPSGGALRQKRNRTAQIALTGAGTVSPSVALNFKMVAELGGGKGAGGTQRSGRREGRSGDGIPFTIEGTTADPKFVPDVKRYGQRGQSKRSATRSTLRVRARQKGWADCSRKDSR